MNVTGTGYVVMPFTRRIGFYVGASVEYLPDFRMEEDATYVWGKFSRLVAPPDLRIIGVENSLVNLATKTPIGTVASILGGGIVASEIGRGFTVVHSESGDEFALGRLEPPAKPPRPFVPGTGRTLLAGDETTVYAQAREFLGPFTVDRDGAALYFRANTWGATPLTYALVERSSARIGGAPTRARSRSDRRRDRCSARARSRARTPTWRCP